MIEHFENICFYAGIFATVILLLKTFVPVDFGSEVGGDFGSITDTDASFNLLSIESLLSYVMCFGWMGWWCMHIQHNPFKLALLIAVVSGVIGMVFFAFLFAQMKKLEFVPKNDLKDLENTAGKSYTRFAPKGNGQIQIEFNQKLATLDAINNSDEEINSFEQVKVVKVENNTVYIEKNK